MKHKDKNLNTIDTKGEYHGYTELYYDDTLWVRGVYKHGIPIGYREHHRQHHTWEQTIFFIK